MRTGARTGESTFLVSRLEATQGEHKKQNSYYDLTVILQKRRTEPVEPEINQFRTETKTEATQAALVTSSSHRAGWTAFDGRCSDGRSEEPGRTVGSPAKSGRAKKDAKLKRLYVHSIYKRNKKNGLY